MEPARWSASWSPIQTSSVTATVPNTIRSHPTKSSIKETMRRYSFRFNRFTILIKHEIKVHAKIMAINTWSNGNLCWCHLPFCSMKAPEEPRRNPVGIFLMSSTASLPKLIVSPTAPEIAAGALDAWAAIVLIPWVALASILCIGIDNPRALSGLGIWKC